MFGIPSGALRFLVLHIRSGISGTLEIKIFSSSPALIVRVLFMLICIATCRYPVMTL